MNEIQKEAFAIEMEIEGLIEKVQNFRDRQGRSEEARLLALSATDLQSASNWLVRLLASQDGD